MASKSEEIHVDLFPVVRVYKDGTVERFIGEPYFPPSSGDPITGVSYKDITISLDISSRLFLPKLTADTANKSLPILVYFHGGGLCAGSAFSSEDYQYMSSIVSQAKALVVSIEYRLAPEHLLPTLYEDCWAGLEWVASHSVEDNIVVNKESWLLDHGDFNRVFIGGDSAGGNIVHNIAMRAGVEHLHGGVKILGAFLSHPYFMGSKPLRSDESIETHEQGLGYRVWLFAYPSAPGGLDNPMVNPFAADAPSLSVLGCSRLLVCVAEKDGLREWGLHYAEAVKQSGWKGEVELIDVQGEDHCFHLIDPGTDNAKNLIKRLASFVTQ